MTVQEPARVESLSQPLSCLKGVGERMQEKLARLGLHTVEDLLFLLPLRYEDHRQILSIAQLRPGRVQVFCASILSSGEVRSGQGKRRLYQVLVADDSGQLLLKWFHYRRNWMDARFVTGRSLMIVGEVKLFSGRREILHPDVEFSNQQPQPRIVAVYPLTEGLSQKQLRQLCAQAVEQYAPRVRSHLPATVIQKRGLLPLATALLHTHFPPLDSDFEDLQERQHRGRYTLIYEELFYFQLGLCWRRLKQQALAGRAFKVAHRFTKPLLKLLPYDLTPAQRRVLGEIKQDMMASSSMNRLLQGDVGSGKTLVALMAALLAIENNAQCAVLAPTEILAEQHFQFFSRWLESLGLNAAMLTGSTSASKRRELLAALARGEVHLLVGTHALLQADVEFHDLGLVIVDEQHRFGVEQRNSLRKKGSKADVLVMTATPIPRTLSMTLYGDLAVSIIDQLPPGRAPVTTRIVAENKRGSLYDFIQQQIEQGRQIYFIYPLVDESDTLELTAATQAYEDLTHHFPQARLSLLHGRLTSAEKEQVMGQFAAHETDILVATTVIEVGIDVPNASLIVIEHAERFGLAQLHQLRGRVGRGEHKSYCFLLHSASFSKEGRERLDIMEQFRDGFAIAEADLKLRGPGEFLGTRQAGVPSLRLADLVLDQTIHEQARADAIEFLSQHDIMADPYRELRRELQQRWGRRLELAHVG